MSHFMSLSARIFARIFCGVKPALRKSEPFDELSARIFVRGGPQTGDTWRIPIGIQHRWPRTTLHFVPDPDNDTLNVRG